MQIKKIVFSKKAKERLFEIAQYIKKETQSDEITLRYIAEIRARISILKTYPKAGREAFEFGVKTRKLVVSGYSILYEIDENKTQIEILNIFKENLP